MQIHGPPEKKDRKDLSGVLLAYSDQGSESVTPHVTYNNAHTMVAEMLWMSLVLLQELQQNF